MRETLTMRGTAFELWDPDASLLRDALPGCAYEASVYALLERAMTPASVLFDVGALYGAYAVWAARRGNRVVAFEPNSEYAEVLRRNLQRNGCEHARVETVALAADAGTARLAARTLIPPTARRRPYLAGVVNQLMRRHASDCVECLAAAAGDWRAGALPWLAANARERLGRFSKGADQTPREVETETLDRWCERNGIVPTVVKIDVHGAEADVLRGMRATLRDHVQALVLELHTDDLRSPGTVSDLLLELERAGMEVFEIRAFRRNVAHLVPMTPAVRASLVDQRRWTAEELYFMRCLYARR